MAFRFYIDNNTGQVLSEPGGGAIGEEGAPIPIPRATTEMQWQWGTMNADGTWLPKRKPLSTTIDFGFKPLTQFEGPWVVYINQATLVRPTSGTGVGYLINFSAGYAPGRTAIALDGGTGTILVGDVIIIGNFRYVVLSALSGGNLVIEDAGLREFVPDNYPVIVDTEAGFYTANFLGDTTGSPGSRELLFTPDGILTNDLDALQQHGALLWTIPTNTGAPESTQRIYATLYNSFDQGAGSSASLAGSPFRFFPAIVGITGGGVTKLDGIATLLQNYNTVSFNDSTTGTGYRVYQLAVDDASTVGRVATSDDITKVWYPRN